jgi:hypothetical protein
MSTPPSDGTSLLASFARTGKTPAQLEALLKERGEGGLGTAMLVLPVDDADFLPDHLEGAGLPEERLDALYGGSPPTAEELALWRARRRETVIERTDGWHMVVLWQVDTDDALRLYALTLMEDGGSWADVLGPFHTPVDALEYLRTRGEVSEVSWPDSECTVR